MDPGEVHVYTRMSIALAHCIGNEGYNEPMTVFTAWLFPVNK
jgi:hypothetical protein